MITPAGTGTLRSQTWARAHELSDGAAAHPARAHHPSTHQTRCDILAPGGEVEQALRSCYRPGYLAARVRPSRQASVWSQAWTESPLSAAAVPTRPSWHVTSVTARPGRQRSLRAPARWPAVRVPGAAARSPPPAPPPQGLARCFRCELAHADGERPRRRRTR